MGSPLNLWEVCDREEVMQLKNSLGFKSVGKCTQNRDKDGEWSWQGISSIDRHCLRELVKWTLL